MKPVPSTQGRPWIPLSLLAIALVAAACSDSAPAQVDGLSVDSEVATPNEVLGDIDGVPFGEVTEALYALSVINDTVGQTALLDVSLYTETDHCQPLDTITTKDYANAGFSIHAKESTEVASGEYTVVASGDQGDAKLFATARVSRIKVGGVGSVTYPAQSGSVTLVRFDDEGVEGSFTFVLAGGDRVSGTFNTKTFCQYFVVPPEGP